MQFGTYPTGWHIVPNQVAVSTGSTVIIITVEEHLPQKSALSSQGHMDMCCHVQFGIEAS